MNTILRVIMWFLFWPILIPVWLWRRGKLGQIVAGGWLLILFLAVLASLSSPAPPAAREEVPAARQSFPTFTPTAAAAEQPQQAAPPIAPIDTPTPIPAVATDTPIPPTPIPVQPTDTPIPAQPAGAIANNGANLRAGPGTNFPVSGDVTVGQPLDIVARTTAGDWYQLEDGNWIAAFLVDNAPTVPEAANVPQPVATSVQSGPGILRIIAADKRAEFVTIQNVGGQAVNMRGWTLNSEKGSQSWTVPIDFVLQPGATVRIHALSGQNDGDNLYSGFGNEIWNNSERDPAVLYDQNGVEVSRF